jgi:hypothetical protein
LASLRSSARRSTHSQAFTSARRPTPPSRSGARPRFCPGPRRGDCARGGGRGNSEAASASTIKRHAHDLAVANHPAAQLALLVEIETHLDAVVAHVVLLSASSSEDQRHSPPWQQPAAGELLGHLAANVVDPFPIVCALAPHGGERGHAERHHHVDLVRLLVLRDAPTARGLDRNGARDCETYGGVGVGDEIASFDQLIQFWLASVRFGALCGNASIRTPSRRRRCAEACIW